MIIQDVASNRSTLSGGAKESEDLNEHVSRQQSDDVMD